MHYNTFHETKNWVFMICQCIIILCTTKEYNAFHETHHKYQIFVIVHYTIKKVLSKIGAFYNCVYDYLRKPCLIIKLL